MSVSVCSISGQPLANPVASIKTGYLYERETIEKHLSSFPYCPITNQPMGPADLIPILSHQGPCTRQDQSPITYLHKIEREYDLLVLDSFKLRKGLRETEEEITSSLYQNQAANRVIAKLLKEKEDLEGEAQKLQARIAELRKGQ